MNKSVHSTVAWLALAIATVAGALSLLSISIKPQTTQTISSTQTLTLLDRINKTGELAAGYGVYPPYTQEDPNTRQVSGYSVEIIEQICRELHCKVVWHRFNWDTMSADLKRGEFDVIADPIFETIPRAREFAFSASYASFADGIAVVKIDDDRFTSFDDLDRPDVTIAVGQGWASETLVKARFTKAKIDSVQTATDLLQVFNELVSGRADVVVADGADAQRFVKEHSDKFKALWLDNPPAFMPAAFALRPDDTKGAAFLTVVLHNLQSTGVLEGLARKYGLTTSSNKIQ